MGAHVYMVGIGVAVLMILIEEEIVSPSSNTDIAFLIRVTFEGGSNLHVHVALQFCSHFSWTSFSSSEIFGIRCKMGHRDR